MFNKLNDYDLALLIAKKVKELGGNVYFVGGYVRDKLLGIDNKDIDIEVHGITPSQLEGILDDIGERLFFGESFGVYSLKGSSIDIAMPRKEKQIGVKHTDFDIMVDPFMGTYNAALRRDFTINALMQDVLTNEIIDHFNGQEHLNNKIIKHINDTSFQEDPLRVLRAAQFAARFEFQIDEDTIDLCKHMDITTLPKERIEEELKKALVKSNKPSIFFEELRRMNQLDYWFKELKDLIGVEQNPKHHAEGDVWIHTMMVLDEGVKYLNQIDNHYFFMLSCVTHDFGKYTCTKIINGEIKSYGHEVEGIPIANKFLKRITNDKKLIEYVLNMTKLHMKPHTLAADNASIKSTNKMFDESVDPIGLICIAIADSKGKIANREYVSNDEFLYTRLEIYNEYMARPYVTGKDLIDNGLTPGKNFSEILEYAHKLRLAGVEKNNALKQTLAYARKYPEYR